MTTETALTTTTDNNHNGADHQRKLALLRAVGLDRLAPEQRELAVNIATRYELDLLLKHLVMIDGRPYITRDGLLHIAHRSGQLDGIVSTEPVLADGFWRATCSVYRKDMKYPFTYTGRYPEGGRNKQFAPEMAVKVGEVMSLRRAFDVSAPTAEERWDNETVPEAPPAQPTLAERAAARAAEVSQSSTEAAAQEAPERATPAAPAEPSSAPVSGDTPGEPEPDIIAPSGELTLDEFRAKARERFMGTTQVREAAVALFDDRPPSTFRADPEKWGLSGDEWQRLATEMGL